MFVSGLQEILLNPNNLPKNPVLQVLVSLGADFAVSFTEYLHLLKQ